MANSKYRDWRRGSFLLEFAVAFALFLAFAMGLVSVGMWGIGGFFVQNAAYEAARTYAVTADPVKAREMAQDRIGRWGFAFLDPSTVRVSVRQEDYKAVIMVSAEPRVKRLYVYEMPEIRREASCAMEYRFRNPGEFLQ